MRVARHHIVVRAARLQVSMLAALALWMALPTPGAAGAASPSPMVGTALWVNQLPAGANAQSLAVSAAQAHARALYIKAADGVTSEPQFSAPLVAGLRAQGLVVCAWVFAYGNQPLPEAHAALAAVDAGAGCLVVDAEGAYDKRYGQAQVYVRSLRAGLGAHFPIGLAGQPEILEHPEFPYSVFLGPGGFGFDMPLLYWRDLGLSVGAAFARTLPENAIYGRPILPVGQLYGQPTAGELGQFRALATDYGLAGESFFDLDAASSEQLTSLSAPLALPALRFVAATIHPGADGDEVDWAQELLNAAGASSRSAVSTAPRHTVRSRPSSATIASPATGVLGPATWKALLRRRAHEPSWASGPPESAR